MLKSSLCLLATARAAVSRAKPSPFRPVCTVSRRRGFPFAPAMWYLPRRGRPTPPSNKGSMRGTAGIGRSSFGRGEFAVIGIGIVGCNYGRTVLLPAFRADPRCEVVALAGTDAARTAELAQAAGVARAFGDWRALVDDGAVAAVAIAVPPDLQPEVARRALGLRSEERRGGEGTW